MNRASARASSEVGTVRVVLARRGRAQGSVMDSERVSVGGSCCTSGTTMPRWSFSKDCFICRINTVRVVRKR